MIIKMEEINDVQLVKPAGRFLIQDGVTMFSQVITDLLRRQPQSVLLVLNGITDIDSSGIGELVTAFNRVKAYGGHLGLVAPTDRTRRMLRTTKLDHLVPCFDTLEQALASFAVEPVTMAV